MSEAVIVAQKLRGHRSGDSWLCRCPLPSHGKGKGDRNPSLLVKDGDRTILLTCFGGCDREDVLAELRRLGFVDDNRHGDHPHRPSPVRPAIETRHDPDPAALALWHAAVPTVGTIAESYLKARGLNVGRVPSLRFLPSVPYMAGVRLPAMVSGVQAPDRRIVAVQLTFLDPRGHRKAQVRMPRKTVGALGAGAVRLGPTGRIIGLTEGTEDALAAQLLTGVSCWACLGAKRMASVEIPTSVKEVHVFADDDDPGRDAAERAAKLHVDAGRTVKIRLPKTGCKDWAEFITQARHEVAI